MTVPDNGDRDLEPEAIAELRRLAHSRPKSGREVVAKASALRTLERLGRGKRQVPPMPAGWYPHEPGDPLYELDWVFLHEHPEILRRHWEMAWREGRVGEPRLLLPQTVPIDQRRSRAPRLAGRMFERAGSRSDVASAYGHPLERGGSGRGGRPACQYQTFRASPRSKDQRGG